ncbi:MAG: hypothetical protein QOF02_2868 [Blastocatellia bacterium]|jgi:Alw26I/Eco31I/Esp3I family type II restriction m6 adenine DNA methyltransferase|nr:hypothetical protein [Blastocatellia bacterium]
MLKPPFEKVAGQKLDEALRKFFIEGFGYERIDNDPGEKPGEPHYWRMVVPATESQPFAIAHQPGLSAMERRKVSKLYIDKVIPHRDGSPAVVPSLYGFTDGARHVFFSSDPARNRDDRFDLSEETWEFRGVKAKVERLRIDSLEFQERPGRKRPRVEFLFEAAALSADDGFKRYVHAMRRKLMGAVVTDHRALGAVVYHLLETPEARGSGKLRFVDKNQKLKVGLGNLHLEFGMRLGDALAAAVDTLLLRYIVARFLEAYHPDAMEGLLDSGRILKKGKRGRKVGAAPGSTKAEKTLFGDDGVSVAEFSATELEVAEIVSRPIGIDVSKAKRKARGSDAMLSDLYGREDEATGVGTVLAEEDKRKTMFGGDFCLADLGKAARGIQKELLRDTGSRGSKLIRDFLGRTGERDRACREFRYEDLRPKTLQDYYESSLGAAVQLTYDKESDSFKLDVGENRGQRKELGAYYTEERLCRLMVERAVKPVFETLLDQLRKSIAGKNAVEARRAFDAIVNFSVCDPTMGSAPFLRSAFDYLSEQYLRLCRIVIEAKSSTPAFYDEATKDLPFLREEKCRMDEEGVGRWEWHILRQMLYGIDIDLKALNIACQTFTLSALKRIKQGERFPSFFNVNLKLGNALISPTKPGDRPELSRRHGKEIAGLIKLRREAKTLPNTERAYEKLATLFRKVDEIRAPIVRELVQERLAPALEKHTDELRPFCWELEFPELFFNADGSVKEAAGFDVIIGNPPWESLEVQTNEFFEQFHKGYSALKPAAKKAEMRKKLLADHSIERAFAHRKETVASLVKLVKPEAGFFELQHTVLDGERKRSEYATHKMIVEQCLRLVKPGGRLSLVVPSGFTGDLGCYLLRRRIFESCNMPYVRGFRETSHIFPTMTQAFNIFCLTIGGETKSVSYLAGLMTLDNLDESEMKAMPFPIESVKRMSPLSWALPPISDDKEFSILDKLYKFPVLNEKVRNGWNAKVSYAEFNATNDAKKGLFLETGWEVPLWEGKLMGQYQRAAIPNMGIRLKAYLDRRPASVVNSSRVVIRDVAGSETVRRLISTILPPGYAVVNTLNYLEPAETDEETKIFLAACLNSFLLEWRARQVSTSNHMNGFVLRQLPVPRLAGGDKFFDEIVERSASLLLADDELKEPFKDLKVKPVTDQRRRVTLRCEIDAHIAAMYELTEAELQLILDTFSDVDAGERQAVMEAFRDLT